MADKKESKKCILFYTHHHNDIDWCTPIIYKILESTNIHTYIINISEVNDDYRLGFLRKKGASFFLDNNSVVEDKESKLPNYIKKSKNRVLNIIDSELIKRLGRSLPTKLPERLYDYVILNSSNKGDLPYFDKFFEEVNKEVVAVAMDWSVSKAYCLDNVHDNGIKTVVYPHGDRPLYNAVNRRSRFEKVISNKKIFENKELWEKINHNNFNDICEADYLLMPNELNARKAKFACDNKQIKLLGSSRYNEEWLNILDQIRPTSLPGVSKKFNLVVFSRNSRFFIRKQEVKYALQILTGFPEVHVIYKEHPRDTIFNANDPEYNVSNLDIVTTEFQSTALIEWGDIFFDMGTSICYEPIMRNDPVLCLSFVHSNYNTIANYFDDSDIRTKDALFYSIHELVNNANNNNNFYNHNELNEFKKDIIYPGGENVLKKYVEFFKSLA